jgi:hypothetical protein
MVEPIPASSTGSGRAGLPGFGRPCAARALGPELSLVRKFPLCLCWESPERQSHINSAMKNACDYLLTALENCHSCEKARRPLAIVGEKENLTPRQQIFDT